MENGANVSDLYQVAEIELVYRTKVNPSQRPKITNSRETFEILSKTWNDDKIEFIEQFKVIFLNRGNRVLGIYELSAGGTCATICDVKLVFAAAIKSNASSVILAHNHPSGQLFPSEADKRYTQKLVLAGALMEIPVLDHLIITRESFYSFADNGII